VEVEARACPLRQLQNLMGVWGCFRIYRTSRVQRLRPRMTAVTEYSSSGHYFLDAACRSIAKAAHDRFVRKIALTAIVDQADNSTLEAPPALSQRQVPCVQLSHAKK
jgi:hypothetical protein